MHKLFFISPIPYTTAFIYVLPISLHYLEYFYRAQDQNSNIQYYFIYSKLALRLSSYFFLHQSTSVLQKDDMFTFAYLTIGIQLTDLYHQVTEQGTFIQS